uniref:Type 1 glutamine amidotransferase domain-containing protein n=1 Tax=Phenylobacterium glaciei TaxID=2803784 RepID=A0A974SAA1_9CAUL|nr:type 1 glutamine amidotransferase domain-containing protein [Phenylobacterium glaciei]
MVLTSHDRLGDTGEKTGFWLEEFAAPYYVLRDAGADITLASPKGGQPPGPEERRQGRADPGDRAVQGRRRSAESPGLHHAAGGDPGRRLRRVFFPGGHGPMWDLAESAEARRLVEAFAANDRPIAAVCHAPAVFRRTVAANGEPLVSGRRVTGFTNSEEDGVGLSQVVPFLLEDMLKANGGLYEKGPDQAPTSFGTETS